MEIEIVAATVVLVVVVAVVLLRQGPVGRLSEEDGRRSRQADVAERPGGPGVESMRTDVPGEPVTPPPDPQERSW